MDSCRHTPRRSRTSCAVHKAPPTVARRPASRGSAAGRKQASQDRERVRKMEPLRGGSGPAGGGEPDTRAGGERCCHAHGGFAHAGAWLVAAARVGPPPCRPETRTAGLGRNCSRSRRADRSDGRIVDEGQAPRVPTSQPPVPALWTTTTQLCEASTVRFDFVLPDGIVERKAPAPTGAFASSAGSPKHTSHPTKGLPSPAPLPPRYARDDVALQGLCLDLESKFLRVLRIGDICSARPFLSQKATLKDECHSRYASLSSRLSPRSPASATPAPRSSEGSWPSSSPKG